MFNEKDMDSLTFPLYATQTALAMVNFILTWLPESPSNDVVDDAYESSDSWINTMVYAWLSKLISIGYRKTKVGDKKGLEESDVRNIKNRDSTVVRHAEFERNWKDEVSKLGEKDKSINLYWVLWRTFHREILTSAGWKLINDTLNFLSPQLIKRILAYIESGPDGLPIWLGYLYATGLLLTACSISLALQRYWYHANRVGVQVKSVLTAALYKKSLRINFAGHGATTGEVVNYMSVDAQKFQDVMNWINMLWSAPLQISLALYFLYNEIGWPAFMALLIFVIVAPLSSICTRRMRAVVAKLMKAKDSRIKLISEMLNGIKVLKLYAWELPFMERINQLRLSELRYIKFNAYYQAVVIMFWEITPYLVQLVCFTAYTSTSSLDAETVYTSISLFNILRFPINILPMVSIMLINLGVANERITKFLCADEIDRSHIASDESSVAINIDKASFSWSRNGALAIDELELTVEKGKCIAIVGPVGCGKSALISALLGELSCESKSSVTINGTVALVPQQAWIQNMTLKENITFSHEHDEKHYANIIANCALQTDLNLLVDGDQTEIGEKGINLSGGQKQRVSIARAVYANADIYLFDDPLSAVDAHVGREIFDNVLGKEGLLKDKTRVLVTHSTQYLADVDHILVMDKGGLTLAQGDLKSLKSLRNERIDEILSVKLENTESVARTDEAEKVTCKKTNDKEKTALTKQEKAEEGALSMKTFFSYLSIFGWGWSIIYLVWAVTYQVGDLTYNIWLSTWVDAVDDFDYVDGGLSDECTSGGEQNEVDEPCDCGYGFPGFEMTSCRGNDFYLGIYGAIGVTVGMLSFIKSMTMLRGILNSARIFHYDLLSGVMHAPMSFFDSTPMGRCINRFSKDLDSIDMTIPSTLRQIISVLLRVMGTLYILATTNVWFLIIVPPIAIILFLVERYYIVTNRQVKRLEAKTRSPIYSLFGETIAGSSLIRAYKAEEYFIAKNFERVDYNLKFKYVTVMCNRWLGTRLEFVANLITFSVALYAIWSRDNGSLLSAAEIGLALTYAASITQTLNHLIRVTAELETNLVAVERIVEYAELESEKAWRVDDVDKNWIGGGAIKFEKYGLKYRDELPLVLNELDIKVDAGERIGIVGRTGAGKSSITVGLFRLVEAAVGRIKINTTNIETLGMHDLREALTIIPQEPVLFSGTIRQNLDPFERFDDDKLWEAVNRAHLSSTVNNCDGKLDHKLTENGSNLSVGEKQLVCLARALLRRLQILVLDEATSAVDSHSDKLIQKTIREEFRNTTILTIAHRLNTIVDYDRVLVLDQGKAIEFDTPLQLYENNGPFMAMCMEAGVTKNDIQCARQNGSDGTDL